MTALPSFKAWEPPDFDPIAELGKLLEEAGAVVYMHQAGCSMKLPCKCRDLHLVAQGRRAGINAAIAIVFERHGSDYSAVETLRRLRALRDSKESQP